MVAVTTILVDLVSTAWANAYLRDRDPSFLSGLITFHLVYNTGAAFGLGQRHEWLVEVGEVVLLLLLAVLFRHVTLVARIGIAMAIGGGVGNLLVRLTGPEGPFHSPVIDWISLSFYPATFNLADLALRVGVVVAIVGLIMGSRRRQPSAIPSGGVVG